MVDAADRERRWALVWQHRERMLSIARARVPSADDAEDVVAEAMLRAVEYERLDESRVGAFLCTVVMRLAVDTHRDRTRYFRASVRACTAEPAAPPVDDTVCDREEARWLAAALGDVRGRERQLLEGRAAGRSVAETAAHLGISPKAAENAWTRVRAKAGRALTATLGVLAGLGAAVRRTAQTPVAALAVAAVALVAVGPGPRPVATGDGNAAAVPSASPAATPAPRDRPQVPAARRGTAGVAGRTPPATRVTVTPSPVAPAPAGAPVVRVGEASVPGLATAGETRVRRGHEEETLTESALRCVGNLEPRTPLRDPCDYRLGFGGLAAPGT